MKAVYVRVSTKRQEKGHSIEEQIDLCVNYIKSKYGQDFKDYEIYNDNVNSSQNLKRKQYLKLKADIENNLIDELIVFSASRINRLLTEALNFIYYLKDHNIKITSIRHDAERSTPTEELSSNIVTVLDDYFIKEVSVKTRIGIRGGLKKGVYSLGNKAPFGYVRSKTNKLIFDEDRKEIVYSIINDYINTSVCINDLCRIYKLHFDTVKKILTAPIYRGYVERYGERFENLSIPYYIENSETHKKLIKKSSILSKKDINIYLFKDKLVCSVCGQLMKCTITNKVNKKYIYYTCNHQNKDLKTKRISEENIKKILSAEISNIISNISDESIVLYSNSNTLKKINNLKENISNCNEQINRVQKLYIKEHISEFEYDELIKNIKKDIEKNRKSIDKLNDKYRLTKYHLAELIQLNMKEQVV